jgi:hypothetical protein
MPLTPSGFDPLTASDSELAFYHFPARPQDPQALSDWNAEWSHFGGLIVPTMCTTDQASIEAGNLLTDSLGDPLNGGASGAAKTSNNWAGVAATGRTNYTTAYGSTVVSTQTLCAGTQTSEHVAWVGIGGDGNQLLLQNGYEQYSSTPTTSLWYEGLNATYDTHIVRISMGVKSGDSLNIATHHDNGTVTYQFHNLTTGIASNPAFATLPAYNRATGAGPTNVAVNTMYNGSSAEVIDERPFNYGNRTLDQLRQFGRSSWSEASAATGTFTTRTAMRDLPHDAISMVNKASTATLAKPSAGSSSLSFYDTWYSCGQAE